jgi:thiamine monophosphate synthase
MRLPIPDGERTVTASRPERVPRLYLVAARAAFTTDAEWLDAIERVAAAAVHIDLPLALQIRIETTDAGGRLAAAALERARRPGAGLVVFLNAQGLDAASLGYDGVHWAERCIPEAPSSVFPGAASVHSIAALRRAEAAEARFALFGPVWSPSWKPARGRGLGELAQLVCASRIPVLAIGGVTPDRVAECLHAGAAGVAVVSGVFHAGAAGGALATYAAALAAG